jgi:hypothetical protein
MPSWRILGPRNLIDYRQKHAILVQEDYFLI